MVYSTPKKRVLFVRRFTPVLLAVFGVFSFIVLGLHSPKMAYATASSTVNFQARLQSASGAIVPDGYYNVEFKLYGASSGGSALWTEDYTHTSGPGSTDVRLQVKDGYLSAALGSITVFPGTLDWSQQMYLTMNIGGSGTTASWDGEMSPRLALTASTYAFNAGSASQAGELSSVNSSNTSTLAFQGSSNGNQNFIIQDQGAAGTYDLLTTAMANNSYVQLQTGTPAQQTGKLDISGSATVGSILTNTFDTASAGSITIGGTNATSISLGNTAANTAATINGTVLVKPTIGNDSTTAFQVQNAGGNALLNVDTANSQVDIGGITSGVGALNVRGFTTDSSSMAADVTDSSGNDLIQARDDGQIVLGKASSSGATTIGHNTVGTNPDNGFHNLVLADRITTGSSAIALTSISAYVQGPVDVSPNNKYIVGVYGDSSGSPGALLVSSAQGTLTNSSWNTLSISYTLSASTTYWLAFSTNTITNNNFVPFDTASSNSHQYMTGYVGAGTSLPSSFTINGSANSLDSIYASGTLAPGPITTTLTVDPSNGVNVQTPMNTATAFQVQNASNVSLFAVDTSGSNVNIGATTTTISGTIHIGSSAGSGSLVDNGTTQYAVDSSQSFSANGSIANINLYSAIVITATNSGLTLTLPDPSPTTAGKVLYISNNSSGSNAFTLSPTHGSSMPLNTGATTAMLWNGSAWTYSGTDASSILNQNTTTQTGNFKISGTGIANALQAASFDTSSSGALTVGGGNATTITIGGSSNINTLTEQGSGITQTLTGSSTAPSDVVKTATNSTAAFQVQNASGTSLLNVDTTNSAIGLGSAPIQIGLTSKGSNLNAGGQNGIQMLQMTTGAAGTLDSISVYFTNVDATSGHNLFQVAVYADSSGTPGAKVASSGDNTINAGSTWSTASLSASLSASTTYWLAINQNGTSGSKNETVYAASGGTYRFYAPATTYCASTVTITYSTWPSSLSCISGNTPTTQPISIYANITTSSANYTIASDSNGHVSIGTGMTSTLAQLYVAAPTIYGYAASIQGETTVNAANTEAFNVINAGFQGLDVDTINRRVEINGSDTSTNATASLSVYGENTDNVLSLMNSSGTAKLFTVGTTGAATFENSTNSTSALQIQNSSATPIFNASTTTSNLVSTPTLTSSTPTNWTAKGTATVSGDTGNGYEGIASIESVATAATSGMQTATFTNTISTGTQYQVTFFARCSSSISTFTYGRQDVSGTDVNATTSASCGTAWQQYTFHYTTGGTITSPNIYMDSGTTTSVNIWVDGVSLVQTTTSAATNYAPGNLYLEGPIASQTIFENTANSTTAFQVQNSSGTNLLTADTTNGRLVVGSGASGETAGSILVLDNDTDSTYSAGTTSNAPAEVNGAMFYSPTNHDFMCGVAGSWETCNGLLYSNTASGSIIASCTTACSALAQAPIPANYCQAGRVIDLKASGLYTTSASTIQFGLYYGASSSSASDTLLGGSSGTVTQVSSSVTASSWTWQLYYTVTCFSSTTAMLQGYEVLQEASAAAGTSMKVYALPITATTTISNTSSGSLYLFPTFGANSAGNNATMEQYVVTGN